MPRTYQPRYVGTQLNPFYKPRRNPSKSGASGARLTKFKRGNFITWDGEGITRSNGKHVYVMLCNSLGENITNPRGLSTEECLAFLVETGMNNPKAIHACFGASYDVNMILADVSREELEKIWAGEWTDICNRKYSVNYRPRKSFTVRRRNSYDVVNGRLVKIKHNGLVLWDVFGFFQSTFVAALDKYLGKDYPLTQAIAQQKKRRSRFARKDIPVMLEYCQQECKALRELLETLHDNLVTADLHISRWDGAGACAAALLRREKITDHKGADSPHEVLQAAQIAYAGGRSEIIKYGHAPNTPIYHYDICSAYPAAMLKLPSFKSGRWIHSDHLSEPPRADQFALYRIKWNFTDAAMYPFFWRANDSSIFYPQEGEGWYWAPEVSAAWEALDRGVIGGAFKVLESWEFIPKAAGEIHKPFEFLPPLYLQRKQWKAQGIGAEKVLKLAINSCYGKLAQHLGGTENKPPRYHKLEWAGYITSLTRANLYRALFPALEQDAAIMVSTDAVYSLVPLDHLNIGSELGEWEASHHTGITVVQSGVYWTDNAEKESGMFCRGFDKGSLDRAKIIRAWNKHQVQFDASLTRFVTMGSALQGQKSFINWRTWRTTPRILALSVIHTKRVDSTFLEYRNPSKGLVSTYPAIPGAWIVGQRMSAPYPLPWLTPEKARECYLDGAPVSIIEAEAMETEL